VLFEETLKNENMKDTPLSRVFRERVGIFIYYTSWFVRHSRYRFYANLCIAKYLTELCPLY
jgi:hypothetical protein